MQVEEFMVVGDQLVNKTPDPTVFLNRKLIDLRNALLIEEIRETHEAYIANDLKEEKDGIADIAVVTYGYMLTIGSSYEPIRSISYEDRASILSRLFIIYDMISSWSLETLRCFESLAGHLSEIISLLEVYGKLINENLEDLVTIVHTSNMTKFPETVEEAELTVAKYANHELYKGVYYKKCQQYNRYVVKSNKDKVLKSINYKDPVWP